MTNQNIDVYLSAEKKSKTNTKKLHCDATLQ